MYVDRYPKSISTYFDLIFREFYSFHVKRKLNKLIGKEKPDLCYLLVYKRSLSPSVIDACFENNLPIINRLSDYNSVCLSAHLYRDGQLCRQCVGKSKIGCLKYNCIKDSRVFSFIRYLSYCFHKGLNFDKKIDKFICTNEFMFEQMIEDGYKKDQLELLPTFFQETNMAPLNYNNDLSNKVSFLFIGTLDEKKGIYDLLDALFILKKTDTNFILNIVGGLDVKEIEKVLAIVDKYGLNEFIQFTPFNSGGDVFEYYLLSNVTIIPCRLYENLPNTIIESIYFQRPVVVPKLGSFMYTVDDTVSFKYEALSVTSLCNTLQCILRDPESIIKKSQDCLPFFKNNFSEEDHIAKLICIFDNILKTKNEK